MAVLFAGDFDDTLLTTANSDPVVGGPGNDYLFSRTNSDTLNQNSVDDLAVTGSIGKGADGIDQSNSTETITAPQSQLSLLNGVPTPTTTVTFTGDDNIDGLLFGTKWQGTTVSFSFPDSINDYEAGYLDRASHGVSFKTLNPAQRLITGAWLQMYGDVSNIGFTELTGVSDRDATIRMAMSDVHGTAFARYPNGFFVEGGDAWFNKTSYNSPTLGTYAYHTFGHELGHALGLKHGHELEGVSGVVMNADRDSMEFSIMTYRSYIGGLTTDYTNEAGGYAQSLMMYDIAAIQHLYGADFDFNSGDTTYTFSTTTGEMFVNGVGQGQPFVNRIFRTIWDGNGIDTYDFSNYITNLNIDLTPGSWVDLDVTGNFQRANLGGGSGGGFHPSHARAHVFNALQFDGDPRSLIENAMGASQSCKSQDEN